MSKNTVTDLLDQRLFYRTMKSNHTYGEMVFDLQGLGGSHIGKAYALKESRFDVPILLDGDVWPYHTNISSVGREAIRHNKNVVRSEAPEPFGGTWGETMCT